MTSIRTTPMKIRGLLHYDKSDTPEREFEEWFTHSYIEDDIIEYGKLSLKRKGIIILEGEENSGKSTALKVLKSTCSNSNFSYKSENFFAGDYQALRSQVKKAIIQCRDKNYRSYKNLIPKLIKRAFELTSDLEYSKHDIIIFERSIIGVLYYIHKNLDLLPKDTTVLHYCRELHKKTKFCDLYKTGLLCSMTVMELFDENTLRTAKNAWNDLIMLKPQLIYFS